MEAGVSKETKVWLWIWNHSVKVDLKWIDSFLKLTMKISVAGETDVFCKYPPWYVLVWFREGYSLLQENRDKKVTEIYILDYKKQPNIQSF